MQTRALGDVGQIFRLFAHAVGERVDLFHRLIDGVAQGVALRRDRGFQAIRQVRRLLVDRRFDILGVVCRGLEQPLQVHRLFLKTGVQRFCHRDGPPGQSFGHALDPFGGAFGHRVDRVGMIVESAFQAIRNADAVFAHRVDDFDGLGRDRVPHAT